jgi:2-phosphosulfolactate phosphatase
MTPIDKMLRVTLFFARAGSSSPRMQRPKLEVILSPTELAALPGRNLADTVCVVFDILRATTSMITALASGAECIIPVAEIPAALALRKTHPDALLAGERNGLRIRADLTGDIDFDLGNSPREFVPSKVQGRTIIMSTTNGTRAIRACAGARTVLISSFLNLRATTNWLRDTNPAHLILICSGTVDEPAFEDILAAGAVCERIWPQYVGGHVSDSAEVARRLYPLMQSNLVEAMKNCRNGRRLLAMPEVRDDVWFCVQRETVSFAACVGPDGAVRKLG